MSRSTGPILATGAVTLANTFLIASEGEGVAEGDRWGTAAKVVVATGLVAGGLTVLERPMPDLAVALGWAVFAGMMLTRLDPALPSPTERILDWWAEVRR
jgi:hypothetical protein